MLNSLAIARRIKSRFARLTGGYAAGPLRNGRDAYVDFLSDGLTWRAYVSPIVTLENPRPAGFDHLFGERPRYDQIRLAEMASKHIAGMAKVCQRPEELAQLEVWHKAGKAGFVVRCASGARFLVEVSEFTFEQQLAEVKAKIGDA